MDAFAAQCVAANFVRWDPIRRAPSTPCCPPPEPARVPARASVAALATAITTALGYPNGDRVASTVRLANTLAAARGGDVNQLNNLINASKPCAEYDGQFVNRCGDALGRAPTPGPGSRTRRRLGQAIPAVRRRRGAEPGECLSWPSGAAPKPVVIDENLPDMATGAKFLVFSDFKEIYYQIADRGAMEIRRLNEKYSDTGMVS